MKGIMKCRRCGARLDPCEYWDRLCIDCMHDDYMDGLIEDMDTQ